mgnify:CR=1 FL=1|jgi:hypothetical protein
MSDENLNESNMMTEQDFNNAPFVGVAEPGDNSELKTFIINYTGNKVQPEDGRVNINMIADTLATEFPEFVFAFAEENFIRGYQVGLEDATNLHTATTEEASGEE